MDDNPLDSHARKIFAVMDRLQTRESARSSDVGEDREEIGSLLDLCGLNKRSFAFVRGLDKMDESRRNDVLRSLDPLLALFQKRWDGHTTRDMFSEAEQANIDAGRHRSDDGEPDPLVDDDGALTDEGVETLAGEFDADLDALDADEEEASSNVLPFEADAA